MQEMRLVIGGYAQGKLDYVLQKYGLQENSVWDSALPVRTAEQQERPVIVNHFHNWMRARIQAGGNPEEEVLTFLSWCEDCIIISDEVGNGIVPVEAFEREYRERMGRILMRLAKRAEGVERVICGIGQKIK